MYVQGIITSLEHVLLITLLRKIECFTTMESG